MEEKSAPSYQAFGPSFMLPDPQKKMPNHRLWAEGDLVL